MNDPLYIVALCAAGFNMMPSCRVGQDARVSIADVPTHPRPAAAAGHRGSHRLGDGPRARASLPDLQRGEEVHKDAWYARGVYLR